MRLSAWLALSVALVGCFAPVSPAQRVSDAARELNLATRFGQVDVAIVHVDAAVRSDFLARRSTWGRELRVVDVEMSGLVIRDETHATVQVDVSWVPLIDDILRGTRVTQEWENGERGWKLVREHRTSGDLGLFGEVIESRVKVHEDVHRPTRTLGAP